MNIEFEGKKKKNLGVKYLIFHSLWNVEVQINSNVGGGVTEKKSPKWCILFLGICYYCLS